MKSVKFRANGGKIIASVRCEPKRDGAYDLKLWEVNTNGIVPPSPWHGNFINVDDDDFALPRPNSANDGRMLQCLVVVAVPPTAKPSTVSLIVTQDDKELGREEKEAPPDSADQTINLWLKLVEA
jgi:hypothetical protein